MRSLPEDVFVYRRTVEFTEATLPAGLRRRHTTKSGVWGRIRVSAGSLRYRILGPQPEEHVLSPGSDGVVEPEIPHEVEPLGEVRFHVEFLRAGVRPSMSAARVHSVIDRLIVSGSVTSRLDGSNHDIRMVSITLAEGAALRRWVLREQAVRTIEIGLAYGFSALHICEALAESSDPGARHVLIDPFQETRFANCGLQILEDAGVESLIEHHAELSQVALPAFLKQGRTFDFAFVDGNHRFDSVFLDLFYLGRLVRKGGVIALDDYDLPGIRRAVSFFLTNLGWRVEETSPADDLHTWIVLRTAEGEDTRDFRHFVEF